MSRYNPLVQPDASEIGIYYEPGEMLSAPVLVETSLHQENHYVDHPATAVRVLVSGTDLLDNAVESLSMVVNVEVSTNEVSSVESLTAVVLKTQMRLLIWQRTKKGFILVGDPARRG